MANEKRLIDANELFEQIKSLSVTVTGLRCGKSVLNEFMKHYRESVLRIVYEAPTVEAVEVVHGRWIPKEYSAPEGKYYLFHCSECGTPNAFERNYCHAYGAKMDGGTQNGDQTDSI